MELKTLQLLESLRLLERRLSLLLLDSALTLSQFRLLLQVDREPSISASELSLRLGISKASVTSSLQELAKSQLISIKPNPNDKRASHIALSESGQARMQVTLKNIAIMESEQAYGTELKAVFDRVECFKKRQQEVM